jgi:hypothetical protein
MHLRPSSHIVLLSSIPHLVSSSRASLIRNEIEIANQLGIRDGSANLISVFLHTLNEPGNVAA